jgi:hypothetical protein
MDGLLDRRRQMVEGLLGLFSQPPVDPSPGANPLFADVFAGYQPPQKDVIGNISSGLARAFSPAEWQRQAASLGQWPDPRSVMSKGLLGSADDIFNMMTNIAPLGIFKGINANLTPAETEMLQKAYALEQQGMGREAIRQATSPPGGSGGWFRAPWDQKWRMEVDDSAARMKQSEEQISRLPANNIPLPEIVNHGPFFEAYPQANRWDTYQETLSVPGGQGSGSFGKELGAGGNSFPVVNVHVGRGGTGERRSITLHELQHGAQEVEGFARGGSAEEFDAAMNLRAKLRESLDNISEARQSGLKTAETWNPDSNAIETVSAGRFQEAEKRLQKAMDNVLKDVPAAETNPERLYKRLAGEAEARLVQARRDLAPSQRAALDPIEQMDTMLKQEGILGGLDDLIARYGDGPAMSQSIPDELPSWAPADRMAQWRTARANAALPVEQGGLGLGPANTAAERSGAMGFNVDAYHGTGADIDEFDITKMYSGEGGSHGGSGFYLAETPQNASAYGLLASEKGAAGNVMPLRAKIDNPMPIDWKRGEVTGAKELSKKEVRKIIMDAPNIKSTEDSPLLNWGDFGHEGFQKVLNDAVKGYAGTGNLAALRNDFFGDDHAAWLRALSKATGHDSAVQVTGNNVKNYVVWNPENIRSRFAAFDPLRRNEADLLASWLLPLMAGGGLLGGYFAQPQAD